MKKYDASNDNEPAMDAAQERTGEPHLRDLLKREHDEAQTRPRSEAFELWKLAVEGICLRDLEQRRRMFKSPEKQPTPTQPKRDEPEMEM